MKKRRGAAEQFAPQPPDTVKIGQYEVFAYGMGTMLESYHEMMNKSAEPRMTRFLAAQLAKSHYYDISRAKRDFNYRPQVSNSEGMKKLGLSLGVR